MRIRIQTYSPLPDVKAWFVPDAHNVPASIADLKDELCRRVQGLKNAQYRGRNLLLLLDDFELLDDSPFSAVRDGDLICVKQLSPPEVADVEMGVVPEKSHGQKRKRSHASKESNALSARQPTPLGHAATSAKTRLVKLPPVSYDSESDSDSSSSSSSTSSTSSSSSSSSSSSTSSTSSSSTSSSPPKPLSSKKAITNRPVVPKPTTTTIHVPPGLGKPSTHSRNKRRRKSREYMKSGSVAAVPTLKGASEVNSIPLGLTKSRPSTINPAAIPLPSSPPPVTSTTAQASSSSSASPARKKARPSAEAANAGSNDLTPAPVYVTQDQVMMSSMRNKNKKKGFKLSMSNPIPQKIVFDEQPPIAATNAPEPSQAVRTGSSNEQMQIDNRPQLSTIASASTSSLSLFNATGPAPNARLVPPSEIQERGELPSNMFVTSVDVEAGIWGDHSYSADNNSKSAKAKKKGKKKKVSYEDEQYYGDDSHYAEEGSWNDIGDGAAATPDVQLDYSEGAGEGSATAGVKFDWDRAEKDWDNGGTLIVSTSQITPGVFVGWEALGINPRTSSPEVLLKVARVVEGPDIPSGKGIVVRVMRRTADNEAAFAFGLNGAAGDEGEEVEETLDWREMAISGWRLLNI